MTEESDGTQVVDLGSFDVTEANLIDGTYSFYLPYVSLSLCDEPGKSRALVIADGSDALHESSGYNNLPGIACGMIPSGESTLTSVRTQ